MKAELILVLLSSVFLQSCAEQKVKSKRFLYAQELSAPMDTAVNGIPLDDTLSIKNILQYGSSVVQTDKYGECSLFCNNSDTELFILCVNYGGYMHQYDKFIVADCKYINIIGKRNRTLDKKFISNKGMYIGMNLKLFFKKIQHYKSMFKFVSNKNMLIYSLSIPEWPYHCNYYFVNDKMIKYEIDYRDE